MELSPLDKLTDSSKSIFQGNYLGAVKRWGEEISVENRQNKVNFC